MPSQTLFVANETSGCAEHLEDPSASRSDSFNRRSNTHFGILNCFFKAFFKNLPSYTNAFSTVIAFVIVLHDGSILAIIGQNLRNNATMPLGIAIST